MTAPDVTRLLAGESPNFRLLKQSNYPRMPLFLHSTVALGLKEEGILDCVTTLCNGLEGGKGDYPKSATSSARLNVDHP